MCIQTFCPHIDRLAYSLLHTNCIVPWANIQQHAASNALQNRTVPVVSQSPHPHDLPQLLFCRPSAPKRSSSRGCPRAMTPPNQTAACIHTHTHQCSPKHHAWIKLHSLQTKRAKKKRKPRLPKGYDPTKPNGGLPPPDPERWLPKWQRSDAKKKQVGLGSGV